MRNDAGQLPLSIRLVIILAAAAAMGLRATSSYAGTKTEWRLESSGSFWSFQGDLNNPKDLRFEVRSGDRAPWDLAHNHAAERCEVTYVPKQPQGKDIWLGFGLMIEPGPRVTSRWVTVGQLHPTEDPGDISPSPAWDQNISSGDVFSIEIRTKAQKPLLSSPAPIILFSDPKLKRGHIYRFIYHLRYDQVYGTLEAWRDGIKVASYNGPLGYKDKVGPYFKFGIYREPAPERLVAHYYDLTIGGQELGSRLVPLNPGSQGR